MSVMQGGKFGHGFAAAGFTQAFAPAIGRIQPGVKHSPLRIAAAAMVGGTASKISGGKFANGAVTAAFSRMFNDGLHFESVTDKDILSFTDSKAEISVEVLGSKLAGVDTNNTQSAPSIEIRRTTISESEIDVTAIAKGPVAVKLTEKGVMLELKGCSLGGYGGACLGVSSIVDSPAANAASRNIIKATTPQTTVVDGDVFIYIQDMLGIPKSFVKSKRYE
ncbi:hypothetical protein [Pseudoalteromonas ardens]|uniref:Uncharacterized protein n=1 Tax=Pseudoalteromonas rubra TaxID=43658 RepID=A0A0L0EUB2_9GAMM|nr:hypothetical protein [Pseudoalteromonas sp. R96]KNC67463.1 hypothetical protein AC626_10660 [Pseudoalteromonas rubra]MDK1312763.1 hypothetical protein [Pseudoalteromonas sp. R96]